MVAPIIYGAAGALEAASAALAAAYFGKKGVDRYRNHKNNINSPAEAKNQSTRMGYKMRRNGTRTNTTKLYRKRAPMLALASAAKVRRSPGLKIGKRRRQGIGATIRDILTPPLKANSKWTFQMDTLSGRVTAATIPVLTEPLLTPLYNQLNTNLTTDTVTVDPTLATTGNNASQYRVMIKDYYSRLNFYNSSTNTVSCRLVWYKPTSNQEQYISAPGAYTVFSSPLNTLMLASNQGAAILPVAGFSGAVGDGVTFDNLTANSGMTNDYQHAGWNLTGIATTQSSGNNRVAYLDPSLVPANPQTRSTFNQFWRELKTENFTLEPGNQFNTSLTMRNRMIKPAAQDLNIFNFKGVTVVGVLYVVGQMVFNDAPGDSTISSGAGQICVMREDTCTLKPAIMKKTMRVNMTAPYQTILSANQGIINTETDDVDVAYDQDA